MKTSNQIIFHVVAFLLSGCFTLTLSSCTKDLSGEYVREYIEPGHAYGNALFGARIQVQQISRKKALVEVEIAVPTAYASSAGHLYGEAVISGNRLLLVYGQPPDKCRMTIEIQYNHASIINIENCSQYHGVGCDFTCGTTGLERIGPPKFSERADFR